MDRGYSTAELAAHSGLPIPSVKLLVREGVLTPSIKRPGGRGHGMVFGFTDVVAASAVNALRFQNMAAKPLRNVVEFLRSAAGQDLTRELAAKAGHQVREPRVLFVTASGVRLDTTPGALMTEEKTAVVHCLDAQHLVSDLWLASTNALMRLDFQEPGPSGRVPRKSKPTVGRRKPSPASMMRDEGPRPRRKGERPVRAETAKRKTKMKETKSR